MKIESITIENIRSYDKETIEFDDGLMLIHGDNGSGKSSLLGSIFGGLYLSNVLDYIDTDLTLDSLVRRTEDKGKISLTFSVGADKYTVDWEISVSESEDGERTASTKSCTLIGDSIDEPVEGVKSVDKAVEEIIGLGPESFVNSVYVQQGDITRMVDANDEKRKEIIDGLLGLSKLDNYIERMHEARREIGAQVRKFGDLLEEKERQLNEYKDKSKLQSELSELKSEKQKAIEQKDKIETKNDNIKTRKNDIKQELDSYNQLVQNYEDKKSSYQELKRKQEKWQNKIDTAEQEKDAISIERETVKDSISDKCDRFDIEAEEVVIQDELDTLSDEYNTLNTEISSLKNGELKTIENTISQHTEKISNLETEQENLRVKQESLETSISEIEEEKEKYEDKLDDIEKELESNIDDLHSLCDKIDLPTTASPKEIRDIHIPEGRENLLERSRNVYESLGSTELKWEQYNELTDSGVCPICNVEHDNPSEDIMEHFEDIGEEKELIQQKADAMNKQQELFDSANQYIDIIIDLKSEKNKIEETILQINQRYNDKNNQLEQVIDEIDEVNSSITTEQNELKKTKNEKESINNKIIQKQDKLEEYKLYIDKLEDIKQMFSTLDELDAEIKDRKTTIEQNKALKKETRNQRLDAEKEKNKLEKELDGIDNKELEEKYDSIEDKLQTLDNLKNKNESKQEEIRDELAEIKQVLKQIESIETRCRQLEDKKVDASEKESEAESIIDTYKNVKTQLRKENIGLLNKYANEVFKSVYHSQIYQRLDIDENYAINLVTGDGVKIKPEELSGGEETIISLSIRAGVYRLLVERNGNADKLPPFILDEPTTYLDTNHVSNLQEVINTITSWDVPQVIIVSHKNDMIQNADVSYEIKKNPVTETSEVEITKV